MGQKNKYKFCDDYVIMYTTKNEPFYIDIDDFERVSQYLWNKNVRGYIRAWIDGKETRLHRYIMNCPDDMLVDHVGGTDTIIDNRKCNLRIVTNSQNQMNRKKPISNKSGVKGVHWDKGKNRWEAQINIENKRIRLGYYKNFEDAVKARKEAEEKYFGEYNYDNSQMMRQCNKLE